MERWIRSELEIEQIMSSIRSMELLDNFLDERSYVEERLNRNGSQFPIKHEYYVYCKSGLFKVETMGYHNNKTEIKEKNQIQSTTVEIENFIRWVWGDRKRRKQLRKMMN